MDVSKLQGLTDLLTQLEAHVGERVAAADAKAAEADARMVQADNLVAALTERVSGMLAQLAPAS